MLHLQNYGIQFFFGKKKYSEVVELKKDERNKMEPVGLRKFKAGIGQFADIGQVKGTEEKRDSIKKLLLRRQSGQIISMKRWLIN